MLFLQKHPKLAIGAPLVGPARDRTRKLWEKQSIHLNSLGGSIKSWRQWRKYWADKKSAVKKKAAQRCAVWGKIGEDMDEMVQLTDIEERILAVIGGEACLTEDVKLIQNLLPSPPTDMPSTSPTTDMQGEIEQKETSVYDSMEGQAASVLSISLIEQADALSPLTVAANGSSILNPQASNHTMSRETSPATNPPRHHPNTRRPRRILPTVPPPSQRRAQFLGLAERFLSVEEKRLEIDRRYAAIIENLLERDLERDRMVSQALNSLGDSIKLIADALNK